METKSLERLALLSPLCRDKAIIAYNEAIKLTPAGVHPFIDQTYRSFEESNKLYAQGRTTKGEIVSNAKGGQSWHNFGLALDFHLQINGKDIWDEINPNWKIVVDCFKKQGFNWGGEFPGKFKDYPHLEYKGGYTLAKLQTLYKAGNFIPGTELLNLT